VGGGGKSDYEQNEVLNVVVNQLHGEIAIIAGLDRSRVFALDKGW
jgi:hypothetical protein